MNTAEIEAWVEAVYLARLFREVHPEGSFDENKRWYPDDREDADDITGYVRSPSVAWPYSYLLRARRRKHCRVLVERAIQGMDVPLDVWMNCPKRWELKVETPIPIVRDYVLGA